MAPIGYQDGISGFITWLRKQPNVPKRGIGYDPADLSTWPWPDKLERTLRILKDEHDAAIVTPAPAPPPPPDPVPAKRYAPRTHNKGLHNQDPCFCCRREHGVTQRPDGTFIDEMGATYSTSMRLLEGRDRDRNVTELKGAESMDGLEPCDPYVGPTGVMIGGAAGYPPGSYER